jgi:sugar phosphate isomerase/epimerase
MKLAVYSLVTPELMPEEFAAAVKNAGIDAVEWFYHEVPEDARQEKPSFFRNHLCAVSPSWDDAHLERFRLAAERHGLAVVGINPDKYLRPNSLETTEKALQAARKLGAGFVRLAVPGYDRTQNVHDLFARAVEHLETAVGLCKQYGVKGLLEIHHKTIIPSASAAYRLCERFDAEWLGVTYDPGNMVLEGFENYRMGMELLGPYLAHVHVKNAAWMPGETADDGSVTWEGVWKPVRQGIVPWRQVIDDLKAVGYDGYLSLEDFSGTLTAAELLADFVSYMRGLIEE